MRAIFKTTILILIILFAFCLSAFAADKAQADIPVKVEGGGTVLITSEVNSPAPVKNILELKKGETGHFYINFARPGEYSYIITVNNLKCSCCKNRVALYVIVIAIILNELI